MAEVIPHAPNACLRRGDGLYEPLTVHELVEGRIAPERIVMSIVVEPVCVPIDAPLPEMQVVRTRTARLSSWLGDPWWCRPVYVEDRP